MKKRYIIAAIILLSAGLIALRPDKEVVQSATLPAAASVPVADKPLLAPIKEIPNSAQSPTADATLIVDGSAYPIELAPGDTVLDAMQKARAFGLDFSGREYPSLGYFVESISGKAAQGGYYWFLYINGISSQTGASQTPIHPGDTVEWRYKRGD